MKELLTHLFVVLFLGLIILSGCSKTEGPAAPEEARNYEGIHSLQKSGNCVTPPSGLVSWWPADGNALDIVSSNNGTLQNGAMFGSGMVDQAFSFDGVNDFVQIAQNTFDGLTDLTVDAWVRFDVLDSPTDAQTIISALRSGVAHYWTFSKVDDNTLNVSFFTSQGPCGVSQAFPFQTDRFYHIAATKAGGVVKFYVDGNEIISQTTSCTGAIFANTGTTLIGGSDPIVDSSVQRPLDGIIDELEIFDRALSASEIQAIYNAGKCKEVTICHKPGTPAQKTLVIPIQALADHLGHGDTIGSCN